jgi:hypothetical protein
MPTFVDPDTPQMRYVRAFNATVDVLTRAAALFDVISQDGSTASLRNDARAKSTEALLDLELVRDQHDAVMAGNAAINAPSPAQVQRTIDIATELAQTTASEKKFAAILKLFTQAVDAINAIHGAGAPAPAPTSAPASAPAAAPAAAPAPGP